MYTVTYVGRNGCLITEDFNSVREAKRFALGHQYDFISLTDVNGDIVYSGIALDEIEPYFTCDKDEDHTDA